jgi:hypothetical protein
MTPAGEAGHLVASFCGCFFTVIGLYEFIPKTYIHFMRAINGHPIGPGANLRRTDLSGCDLSGCDLSGARLHGANLRGSILRRCNLRGAVLIRADLSGADIDEADFTNVDLFKSLLDDVRNWETVTGRATIRGISISNECFRCDRCGGRWPIFSLSKTPTRDLKALRCLTCRANEKHDLIASIEECSAEWRAKQAAEEVATRAKREKFHKDWDAEVDRNLANPRQYLYRTSNSLFKKTK